MPQRCKGCDGTGTQQADEWSGLPAQRCIQCEGTGEQATTEELRRLFEDTDDPVATDMFLNRNIEQPQVDTEDGKFSPQWQQSNKGEPMDIAWRLLKCLF